MRFTAWLGYWLRGRTEPVAHAHWVCEASHAAEGIPERGSEDVGVVRLWFDGQVSWLFLGGWA